MSTTESAALPTAAIDVPPIHGHRFGLRVIAVYEVAKTLLLLALALLAFHLDRADHFSQLVHWLEHLPLTGSSGLRWRLVAALQEFGPSRFMAVGLVALGYAILFGIEGVGLMLGKYWAEWFTVIATASFIPPELYETLLHFGWIKLATLLGNVAIVWYLVRVALQTRAERASARERAAGH